jgi:hypothetical protein
MSLTPHQPEQLKHLLPEVPVPEDFEQQLWLRRILRELPEAPVPETFEAELLQRLSSERPAPPGGDGWLPQPFFSAALSPSGTSSAQAMRLRALPSARLRRFRRWSWSPTRALSSPQSPCNRRLPHSAENSLHRQSTKAKTASSHRLRSKLTTPAQGYPGRQKRHRVPHMQTHSFHRLIRAPVGVVP